MKFTAIFLDCLSCLSGEVRPFACVTACNVRDKGPSIERCSGLFRLTSGISVFTKQIQWSGKPPALSRVLGATAGARHMRQAQVKCEGLTLPAIRGRQSSTQGRGALYPHSPA